MMLVSSIGYLKNSADSVKRVENYRNASLTVATKGMPIGYKKNSKWGVPDFISNFTAIFNSQARLRKRALDMIA